MEDLVAKGKVKAIGVSNFSQIKLEELKKSWKIVPAVNQVSLYTAQRVQTDEKLTSVDRAPPLQPRARAQGVLREGGYPPPGIQPSRIHR